MPREEDQLPREADSLPLGQGGCDRETGQPVLRLTLKRQAPGRVDTRAAVLQ